MSNSSPVTDAAHAAPPPGSGPRPGLPLDDAGWRWTAGRVAPSKPGGACSGIAVRLPHCWNAHEEFIRGVVPQRGWATYQLDVELPRREPDREWRLCCEGFYGFGRAWVNARPAGAFNGDYLGLDLDLSDTAREGWNRITLHVCNRYSRGILPGISDPDFHLYGGMGGGMTCVSLPRVRLVRDACRIIVDEADPDGVVAELELENRSGRTAVVSLQIDIRDPSGALASTAESADIALLPGGKASRLIRCPIRAPRLWSPDSPSLYSVEATIRDAAQMRDRLAWTFGIRTVRFDPATGFTLNGRAIPLRGVNRHENLPGFGGALPRPLHLADACRIKEMGLNFVRLSHYPQSPAFLDACDRLGLLVYAELCSWKQIGGGRWLAAAEVQFERMIRRDRHHPSIILWGLGNEGRHRRAFQRLQSLARSLDPSRATIYAENHAHRARRKKTVGLTDVWGLNYEIEAMDFARRTAPTGCVLVSECANLPYASRGHWPSEAQQTILIRDAVARVEGAGPGAIGWTLWCLTDYATPRRQRWFRECGVLDGWRAAKMAADWIRSRYGASPFISIRGDWSSASGPRRHLYLITNCPEVQMLRADGSGRRLATPVPDLYELDLLFDGGPIRFVGHGSGGTAEAHLDPWDAPVGFALCADPPLADERPNASPVLRCRLQVLDGQGAAVMGYEGEARISLPEGIRASLIGGDRLPVHGGQATFYVEAPLPAAEVPLGCTLDDFPPATLRLFPREIPDRNG